jgi:hypothetical protein
VVSEYVRVIFATDNCSIPANITLTFSETTVPGSCPNNYIIRRTWTATDECLNSSNKTQVITVHDITAPVLSTCPGNVSTMADPGKNFASVSLSPPTYTDNCTPTGSIIITWVMSAPTAGSGTGTIPDPFNFNVGTTTVTYTATDACGNASTCTFSVTVLPNDPPDITCPGNINQPADPGLCSAALNPGFPTLVSGTAPITYTWVMTGATTGSGTGPVVPNPYTFNVGVTTITWRATNIAGYDECIQTITVVDNQPPTFTAPLSQAFCVENIYTALYWDPTMDITPARPEYYLFKAGDTRLNIDPATFADNCPLSCTAEIRWRITFSDGTFLPSLPATYNTGQPSAYPGDIQFPGAVTGDVVHTITYQIVDCNGNVSLPVTINITIKPRPNVIKQP